MESSLSLDDYLKTYCNDCSGIGYLYNRKVSDWFNKLFEGKYSIQFYKVCPSCKGTGMSHEKRK